MPAYSKTFEVMTGLQTWDVGVDDPSNTVSADREVEPGEDAAPRLRARRASIVHPVPLRNGWSEAEAGRRGPPRTVVAGRPLPDRSVACRSLADDARLCVRSSCRRARCRRGRPSARRCSPRRRTCRTRPSCPRARSGASRTASGRGARWRPAHQLRDACSVSTSPVVIVTSRIHSFSRCSVTRLAVHADVRDAPAGTDQLGRELEGRGHPDRLERHVGAEPVGELHDLRDARPRDRC